MNVILQNINAQRLCFDFRYLEHADWDIAEALKSAREDCDWDKDIFSVGGLSDTIQITVNLQPPKDDDMNEEAGQPPSTKVAKPVSYDGLPAIATKNVRPQDVYNVSTISSEGKVGYVNQ